jgi:hypothetical protein
LPCCRLRTGSSVYKDLDGYRTGPFGLGSLLFLEVKVSSSLGDLISLYVVLVYEEFDPLRSDLQ